MKTKMKFLHYALILSGATQFFFSSCEKEKVPILTTVDVTEISQTSALSGGNITDDGGTTVTARGVCWSTSQNPTINDSKTEDGNGAGSFISNIAGLEPNTTYYVRAYATNSEGTGYGAQISFETTESSIIYGDGVTDIDGNEYITVIIGNQEWMAENLRTTTYRNGDAIIPIGIYDTLWVITTFGAYTIYPPSRIAGLNPAAEVLSTYGALYNWYAVVNAGGLCPTGWRVPTDAEWTELTEYAGGASVAGGKLKSTRTYPDAQPCWWKPNKGATDEYGFSGLAGGLRYGYGGYYHDIGAFGYWWSSTENDDSTAYSRGLYGGWERMGGGSRDKRNGHSIRCLREID